MLQALIPSENAPELIANMVSKLGGRLSESDAAAISALARSMAPDDPWVQSISAGPIRKTVPSWHWAIARDERRNAAYDKALRASITSDSVVLEIGTGSGILAMLAARAGARHVYTIEIVPIIAAAARENIRRNGFEDRITVICADATKVTVGDQLPERCNVFLHEIISNDLLAEHVLTLAKHARKELLTEDALHMPENIWMTCQLVNGANQKKPTELGRQAGFDLSAMDILYTPSELKNGPLKDFQPLSGEEEILRFDLTGQQSDPQTDLTREIEVTETGVATAIVQWIGFSFPDGTEFTNPPDQYSSWALRIWRIAEQTVTQGGTFKLRRRYDDIRAMPLDGGN